MNLTFAEGEIRSAPDEVKAWIARALGLSAPTVERDVRSLEPNDHCEELQPITPGQARVFLAELNPKTRGFIEEIVKRKGRAKVDEVVSALGVARYQDLAQAWAGTTRRVRSISNNPGAVLVTWDNSKSDPEYVMHQATVDSFNLVLR